MSCDRFDQRMNVLLDDHQSLSDDPVLQSHTSTCAACQQKLLIWQSIEGIGPACSPEFSNHDSFNRARVSVLAAAFLIAVGLSWCFRVDDPVAANLKLSDPMSQAAGGPGLVDSAESAVPTEREERRSHLDPGRWWESVEPQQWLAQTMPTVRTVQESVAPLSRSLKQAVEILTFGRAT